MKNKFLLRLFTFLSVFILISFQVKAKPAEYQIEQLKIENGLSQSTVLCMIQDKVGFMWFGTGNGLNKYDGYNFTVYSNDSFDSTSSSDNVITALYEDREGYIWFGTSNGFLNKFDRSTEEFTSYNIALTVGTNDENLEEYYEYPISFSRNNNTTITSIAEDLEGKLWIGTWGKGLVRFNKYSGKQEHFYNDKNNKKSLSFNRVTKILVDAQGTVWVGTFAGGLNKLLTDKITFKKNASTNNKNYVEFEHYRFDKKNRNSLSDDKIISLYEDKYNSIWIGTFEGGLNKLSNEQKSLSPESVKIVKYIHNKKDRYSLSQNTVMSITGGKNGELWVGTFGGGLNKFDYASEKFLKFVHDPNNLNSIGDNDVLSLLEDNSGILWIGSHLGEGVSKLSHNTVKFDRIGTATNNDKGLSDNVVWSIYKDTTDYIWVGTYRGGLDRIDKKTNDVKVYENDPNDKNSISNNHVRAIKKDQTGNLWVGTYNGGLNKFDINKNKFYAYKKNQNDPNSIGANQIQAIYIDSNSTFWVGTFGGGLNSFNQKFSNDNKIKFKKFMHDPHDKYSISDNRVYSLFEDKDGYLWVGTFGGGLNKFDKKRELFFHYQNELGNKNSLSDDRVICIYEDTKGNLWVGTYGGGLNKFDKNTETFKRYSSSSGLGTNSVYGILEDDNDNLWLSSDNGIFKFNIKTESFYNYDLKDGLQSLEFSGGAYFKSPDGHMYFGGINGLNFFHPDSIFENKFIPPIVITSVKILNKRLKGEEREITLPYNKNFLTFEFAALDFTNPTDNHYSYKLEGLDKDWLTIDASMRIANYTDLSPGNYVFKVKGSNNDKVWNIKGAEINVTILPPFWATWWFISLCIIIAGMSLYYLSTIRYKNLLSIEKLKTRLAADLHDNIGSGLTEISILSELAAKDVKQYPDRSSQELKTISDISRQLVDGMSDIVWIVNPKRDTLYDLIIRLKDSYNDFLGSMGISFKTNNLDKLKDVKLPIDYKQNLYLIFKEGLNNSIKHSKCTKIFLEANVRGEILEISLRDNGVGIENKRYYSGNGMKNIETRAIALGGKLKWKSTEEGTLIRFVGRMGRIQKIRSIMNKKAI
ncbi:MAG: two-component regulator propeller domain-containing protein [Ignavibacteriaceae bacterium]